MITSLFQRDLTIFYRTHRATMNAGNTLNARIGPFRFSVTRQGNRTGRTDLRTDAARDTGIRSIKSVAAYRKVSEQRIDHIALQKRDTSRIIQRGISLLPDRSRLHVPALFPVSQSLPSYYPRRSRASRHNCSAFVQRILRLRQFPASPRCSA